MGKSAPSPPPPPDPAATAAAQSTANVDTASAQAAMNYVNQKTPYGSTTFAPTGSYTTPSGQTVPTYTENVSLSPLGQSILSGQQTIANTVIPGAENLANQAVTAAGTPLSFDTYQNKIINSTPYSAPISSVATPGAINPQQFNDTATKAIYEQQKSFLDPQWTQQQKDLEDQLSRQGIPVGSDAYNNAMTNFENAKNQAYQSAQDSATSQGAQFGLAQAGLGVQQNQNIFGQNLASEQNTFGQVSQNEQNIFNLALAGQQQEIAQQQLAQQNPIDLLQRIIGAAPGTPSQPITQPSPVPVSPTDVIGAQGLSTNAAMQKYQADLAAQNAMFGGLASLGGAGILALSLGSDRRLKSDIVLDGKLPNDIPLYRFRYKAGGPVWRGVMADDVERFMPSAVSMGPDGFALVDYGMIGATMEAVEA